MDFQKSKGRLASQPQPENFKFERPDFASFRTVEGLQQKAGVAANKLRRLIMKELTDNALDTSALVRIGQNNCRKTIRYPRDVIRFDHRDDDGDDTWPTNKRTKTGGNR
jgi:hypothetical protein